MFGFFGHKKRVEKLEKETKSSFHQVKKDFEGVGKWIKHLHGRHEDVSDVLAEIKRDLSLIKGEVGDLRERFSVESMREEHKQLSKKKGVLNRQEAVYGVEEDVQTAVQTGNFHDILNNLSSNERLIVFALMNTDMKLSYEDLARLLGKERSTIRGQINAIKRKSESLIRETQEQNGKKRLYVNDFVKDKLAKYAKVRVKEGKKYKKLPKSV
jgi:predicted transcriptional regulator